VEIECITTLTLTVTADVLPIMNNIRATRSLNDTTTTTVVRSVTTIMIGGDPKHILLTYAVFRTKELFVVINNKLFNDTLC
jgi:hypothetical protein